MAIGSDETIVLRGPQFVDALGVSILTLDASMSQVHEFSADVTQHPVEDGVNVTDNVRTKPIVLRIEGVVAAYPLTDKDAPAGREVDAWGLLESMVGQVFSVSTSLRTYPSMVLQRASVTRDAGRTDLEPSLELIEIRRVAQQTVTLPPEVVRKKPQKSSAQKKAGLGKQATAAANAAQQQASRRSWAAAIIDNIAPGTLPAVP